MIHRAHSRPCLPRPAGPYRLALALLPVLLLLFLGRGRPAEAHAELLATDPPAGSTVTSAPERVVLFFSERVEIGVGALEVAGASGRRVDTGSPSYAEGRNDAVEVRLLPDLSPGTYAVFWRIVSIESHVETGFFTFHLLAATATDGTAVTLEEENTTETYAAAFGAVRWSSFAAVLVLTGLLAFVALVWLPAAGGVDQRPVPPPPPLAVIAFAASLVIIAAAAAGIVLQSAVVAGSSLREALEPDALRDVLDTRFGRAGALRLAAGSAAALLLFLGGRRGALQRPATVALLAAPALTALVTIPLAGHPSTTTPVWLATTFDAVHLAAAAVWLGGLVALLAVLLAAPREPASGIPAAPRLAARFSSLAIAAVVAVAVTGSVSAGFQVRSFDGLLDTSYGRILLAKAGVVTLAVLGGAYSRRLVAFLRRQGEAGAPMLRLRRSVTLEVAAIAAVLAVTALLVGLVPPRTSRIVARARAAQFVQPAPTTPASSRAPSATATPTLATAIPATAASDATPIPPPAPPGVDPDEYAYFLALPAGRGLFKTLSSTAPQVKGGLELDGDGEPLFVGSVEVWHHGPHVFTQPKILQLPALGLDNAFPAVAPDGGSVVFSFREGERSSLARLSLADGRVEPMAAGDAPGSGAVFPCTWLPGGTGVLLARPDADGALSLLLLDPASPAPPRVLLTDAGPRPNACPALSPDGRLLAFTGGAEGGRSLYLLQLEDGTLRRLLPEGVPADGAPAFTPDGGSLVFELVNPDATGTTGAGERDLAMVSIEGSGLQTLAADVAPDFAPAVSPDGTAVAFLSTRFGRLAIWKLPLAGGEPVIHAVLKDEPPEFAPSVLSWAPDGAMLAISLAAPDGSKLYLVQAASGTVTTMGSRDRPVGTIAWLPDGSGLVF